MISFSMHVYFFTRRNVTQGFGIGTPCFRGFRGEMSTACQLPQNYTGEPTMGPAYTRLGPHYPSNSAMTYDGPDEIKWKICSATRRFPDVKIGVALFNLQSEDTKKECENTRYGNFKYAAGYWRVSQVTDYFRKTLKHPNFMQSGPACSTT
ncbi:uncharacterized protein LOC120836949 [Ixodes scapularis]|uniref:uncharacterized protein LOC120836949 n=1 Tax=Ixodes scapularis TaxID=6945 RepID=UPI001C3915DF|nr:uncharacterized protein LOC120836949 [Ixodes scapularis]